MTSRKDADALVVYATTHGHTAKIAARLAEAMRGEGLEVDLHEAWEAGDVGPGRYDLVVVAGSLHKEHHQKELVEWVADRRDALAGVPSVFLSVSLSAAEDTPSRTPRRSAASTPSARRPAGRRPAASGSRARCSTASTTSSRASSCGCS